MDFFLLTIKAITGFLTVFNGLVLASKNLSKQKADPQNENGYPKQKDTRPSKVRLHWFILVASILTFAGTFIPTTENKHISGNASDATGEHVGADTFKLHKDTTKPLPKGGVLVMAMINAKPNPLLAGEIVNILSKKKPKILITFGPCLDSFCFSEALNGSFHCLSEKDFIQPIRYLILVQNTERYQPSLGGYIAMSVDYSIRIVDTKVEKFLSSSFNKLISDNGTDTFSTENKIQMEFLDSFRTKSSFIINDMLNL